MKITVVQPPYFAKGEPDKTIADFLESRLADLEKDELIVLPEYSNAGGLTDQSKLLAAAENAPKMLEFASLSAKNAQALVAINVLNRYEGILKNTTYLFGKDGNLVFKYHKQHLPPSEVALGITKGCADGKCRCIAEYNNIRFAFMTCYDVYFNEQIEYIAHYKPDIIIIPGYQRGERTDIIEAQAKLTAFRCNAFIARASYSMNDLEHGGNSMIVGPDGIILKTLKSDVGKISCNINPLIKYTRTAGYGGKPVRNDDFINTGACPTAFSLND